MKINLDAIFATAPSPYVLLDTALRMVWMNDEYIKATGRERKHLTGRRLTEAFPAPEKSEAEQLLPI